MSPISPLLASALALVDPTNDAHWTNDGQVRVDVVNGLMPEGSLPLTRQDIIDAAPNFTRATALDHRAKVEASQAEASSALQRASPFAHTAGISPASNLPPPAAGAPTAQSTPPTASVLGLPLPQLLASAELLDRGIRELDDQAAALARQRAAIDQELRQIGARSELLSRARDRISSRTDPAEGIAAYLKRSAESREIRRRRAIAFAEAGTTAKDVADVTRGPSQLDAAMARRTGFGRQRPAVRTPAEMQQA